MIENNYGIERKEEIKKVISYKASISGELFPTYEEAYNDDCENFAENIIENCKVSRYFLKDIVGEDVAADVYALKSRKELEMFIHGAKEAYKKCFNNEDKVKSIYKFPVVLLNFYDSDTIFTLDEVVEIMEREKEDLLVLQQIAENGKQKSSRRIK